MRILTLLFLIGFGLAGCGIKPGEVAPPSGDDDKPYPATYPNPNTDP